MPLRLLPVPALLLGLVCALATHARAANPAPADPLAASDVTWTELGRDSQDSMPLGNGDLGLNVWTEPNGDLLFYISKTDAWSEAPNSELVKLGRIRVTLTPNPFAGAKDFRHHLSLRTAEILVSGGGARLKLWVDAHSPVIRAEISSARPLDLAVTLDPWRTEPKGKVAADVVLPATPAEAAPVITWYHRTSATGVPAALANRTFGATLLAPGLQRASLRELRSPAPATTHRFSVVALASASGPLETWLSSLETLAAAERTADLPAAWSAHTAWWDAFWNRSHVRISGDATAAAVSQGYTLQRFITACAGRGAYPIKFNGSIFVTDNPGNTRREKGNPNPIPAPLNADERMWGGRYWFQNTRPMYWPRLAAGDYDLMLPLFRMYRDQLAVNTADIRKHYGHDGAYFQETAPFWGGLPKITPEEPGVYTKHYYLPIIELTALMLDYHDHTGDDAFAREFLLPVATAGLTFYDEHFPRSPDGKLLLEPVNSIEMFWKVRNPAPDLAAFHFLLPRLLALPPALIDTPTRARWTRLLGELPQVPIGEKNGRRVLLPYEGEQTAPAKNTEVPELYAVYPFRLYGVGKPDLPLAVDTFAARAIKRTKCWHQDAIWAACLGLAAEAKKDLIATLTNRDPRLRFPAFWEKGHDYAPDQDNGGNGEHALQLMLLQTEGRALHLLPAWPAGWNADFKLRAPYNTTVEGRVEAGKITTLKVTPESRRADVVIHSANP